jgi:hypothetical protein
MTLCLALRGSDGILLATDKRTVEYADGYDVRSEFNSARFTFYGRKVYRTERHGITVACSGNREANQVAKNCLNELDANDSIPANIGYILQCEAENWYEGRYPRATYPNEGGNMGQLLFIIPKCDPPIYKVTINRNSSVISSSSKAFIGFTSLMSLFFAERFYDHWEEHSVAELAFLAANVILTAGRMHPDVAGLDVFALRGSECYQYPAGEISDFEKRSRELERSLRERLFSSKNPNVARASCDKG